MSAAPQPKVFLVGAGPGDPGLITLRGAELLGRADVVLYDHLISEQLTQRAPADAELIYVGKRAGKHLFSQDQINRKLIEAAGEHDCVVRLKGGDPYVFGRGGEEGIALKQAGVPFEVVPGVTAAIGACAYAGIPVTHRGYSADVAFITGHEEVSRIDDSQIDWPALARWRGTIVFYMGVYKLAEICERLIGCGMDKAIPAAIIHWGTTGNQATLTTTLSGLPEAAKDKHLRPALIVIGRVVELREQLNWFETQPLFGQAIVVTRTSLQSGNFADELTRLGATVYSCPTIRIEPPDDPRPLQQAIENLGDYDWTIFTSVNAVDQFFLHLGSSGRDARQFYRCRVCAVGSATAGALENHGIKADLVPPKYDAESLAVALAGEEDLQAKSLLLPRADIARPSLPGILESNGAKVDAVIAYKTVPDESRQAEILKIISDRKVDWITFTSSSTAANFLTLVPAATIREKNIKIASIGPQTSRTLIDAGLPPTVQADPHTTIGVIDVICGA
jgi:uroporphyrinogen III methyltransferase/synthase